MLDIISMTTLLIIMIVTAIFMYLVILGSSLEKSEYERYLEDKEQQAYIKDYMEKKRNKKERAGAPIHKRCAGPSVWKPFFILGTVTKLINYLVG